MTTRKAGKTPSSPGQENTPKNTPAPPAPIVEGTEPVVQFNPLHLAAFTALLTLAVGAYYYATQPPAAEFAYHQRLGVLDLYSNDGPPIEVLKTLSEKPSFVVVGKTREGEPIQGITAAFITLSAVTTANGKAVTIVSEQYKDGALNACYLTTGLDTPSVGLSAQDCLAQEEAFQAQGAAFIEFELPSKGEPMHAVVTRDTVSLRLSSHEVVQGASNEIDAGTWEVALAIFPNAREVVEKVNELTSRL